MLWKIYWFRLEGSIAFKCHADQEKEAQLRWNIVSFSHRKLVWFLQAECRPILIDMEVSWQSPAPCRRSGFVNMFCLLFSLKRLSSLCKNRKCWTRSNSVLASSGCERQGALLPSHRVGFVLFGDHVSFLMVGVSGHAFIIHWYIWDESSPLIWIRGNFMSSVTYSWQVKY